MRVARAGRPKDVKKRREAFRAYVKLGSQAEVSKSLGIDPATVSRWANEEDWDGQVTSLQSQVGQRLAVDKWEAEQDLDIATLKYGAELIAYRELAMDAMEAYRSGKVEFEKMADVYRALDRYVEMKMLLEGDPTSRQETQVSISGSLFGDDARQAIRALLQIAIDPAPDALKEAPKALPSDV